MERKEAIRSAYRLTGGNNFYDGMITCSTLSGKAVCRLVWDMNKAENDAYLEKALSGIPEHFSGKLLEVPVGTGILTMPLYRTLPKADITCLDYSADMMGQAQEKADREDQIWGQTMKYAGMWVLFAGSFQKQLTAYDLSLVVVVLQNFYSLLDNCAYDKTKGSSARTFVRDRTPFFAS